jgi:hypothetical protein
MTEQSGGLNAQSRHMLCTRMKKEPTFVQRTLHSRRTSGLPWSGYSVTCRKNKAWGSLDSLIEASFPFSIVFPIFYLIDAYIKMPTALFSG